MKYILLLALLFTSTSHATWKTNQDQKQEQHQNQHQGQHQSSTSNASSESTAVAHGGKGVGIGIGKGGKGGQGGNSSSTSEGGNATGGSIGDTTLNGGSLTGGNSSANNSLENNIDAGVNSSGNSKVVNTVNHYQPVKIDLPAIPEGYRSEGVYSSLNGLTMDIDGVRTIFIDSGLSDITRAAMASSELVCMEQSHGKTSWSWFRKRNKQYLTPAKLVSKLKLPSESNTVIVEVSNAFHSRGGGAGGGAGEINRGITSMASLSSNSATVLPYALITVYCFKDELNLEPPVEPIVEKPVAVEETFYMMRCEDRGDQIKELQILLNEKTVYNLPITGYFGTQTTRAIAMFQQSEGLPINGKLVDKQTWLALNK